MNARSTNTVADSTDTDTLAALADMMRTGTDAADLSDGQRVETLAASLDADTLSVVREDLDARLSEALAVPTVKGRQDALQPVLTDLRSVFVAGDAIDALAVKVEATRKALAEWRADIMLTLYPHISRRGHKGTLTQAALAEAWGITAGRVSQMVKAAGEALSPPVKPVKPEPTVGAGEGEGEGVDVSDGPTVTIPRPSGVVSVHWLTDVSAEILATLPTAVQADSPEDRQALADMRAAWLAWLDSVAPATVTG